MAPPYGAFIFSAHGRRERLWYPPLGMRALGLDVGSKSIGIALTDEANIAAHPLTVLDRVGNSGDAAAVQKLVEEHGVGDVVVGMPYELSGRVGFRARRVLELVDVLRATLGDTIAVHE